MKLMTEKEYKKELIKILKYIDDICIKNNITYSLIGGSLLGAIRHKGIIPWDDDIDIGLLKKDYDKLIEILKKENKDYYLICHETDKNCYFPHTKLVSLRTTLTERNYQKIAKMGVFVDIFIYSYLPDNPKKAYSFYRKIKFYNSLVAGLRKPNKEENKYLLRIIRHIICKYIMTSNFIFKRLNNLYKKYPKGEYILANAPQYGYLKEKQKSSIFNNIIRTKFEDIEVSITTEYDEYLTTTFNDYMTPPPIEKRTNHEVKAYWK